MPITVFPEGSDAPSRATNTNVPLDEIDKDLLLRQSQLLYPEVEDWILNMALEAYINSLGKPLGAFDVLEERRLKEEE